MRATDTHGRYKQQIQNNTYQQQLQVTDAKTRNIQYIEKTDTNNRYTQQTQMTDTCAS